MFRDDLKVRISIIRDMEKNILQEPIRRNILKKLNELFCARNNLRLQFYNTTLKELDIKTMIEQEAILFIKFQEKLITHFGCCNSEFGVNVRSIMETCNQCEEMGLNTIRAQAKLTLSNISNKLDESSNIMKTYRLRYLKRCQTILEQNSEEILESV